jgi:hypothetical protein
MTTQPPDEMDEFNQVLKKLLQAPPPQKPKKLEQNEETDELSEEAG